MKTYRWEGTATATSSIVHGGDVLGTVTYFRREKFLSPDGTVEEIPVLSGNSLRGLLRDAAADLFWERLGQPSLPLPVVHALWAGGALVKAKGEPVSGQRLATLRRLVPHVGVFGAAGGGRIISGALQVGKLVPVCAQTAHLLPDGVAAGPLPDLWDLLQVEYYNRLPQHDAERRSVPGTALTADSGEDTNGTDGQIRYGVETLIAGTRFHTWLQLTHATGRERAFFADALARYSSHSTVGGRQGKGHGTIRLDLTERCLTEPADHEDWRDLTGASVEEVLEVLRWLD